MSLRDLYQEIIVDHGKTPRNFGKPATFNHRQTGHNPLCGDKLVIYLSEREGFIEEVHFEGVGCAISVASASLMTEAIKGKSVDEINRLFESFHAFLTAQETPHHDIGKLAVFSGVAEFPVRVKCATLAWHTLKAALNDNQDIVSTE